MANVYAVKSGDWSDPTVWNTGELPTEADDVWANTYTVTIDISPTVLSIRNNASSPIVAGGSFVPNDSTTLTCTGVGILTGGGIITSNLTSGQSFTLLANIANSTGPAVTNASSGTLNYIGNITTTSSSFGSAVGVLNNSTGVINITGDLKAGLQNANVAVNASGGTINITGSVTGGTNSVYPSYGARNSSSGTINIVGTCTGDRVPGANNASTGTITITGTIQASAFSSAVTGASEATTVLTGPFLTSSTGINPVIAPRWRLNAATTQTYLEVQTNDLAIKRNLYTAESVGGNPAPLDVRLGTTYGPNDELTGTCAIPPATAVRAGTPVDDTVGTGDFSANAQEFWDTPIEDLLSTSPEGSIGKRMGNAPTAKLIGEYLATYDRA